MKQTTGIARKPSIVIVLLAITFVSFCLFCPFSNAILVRPIRAQFDSHYTSGDVAPIPFERDLWMKANARNRVGMARFLVESKNFERKTHAELVKMLGEPDLDVPELEGKRWLLGYHAKGLFDESIWLAMTMDEKGEASGVCVWTDWYDPRKP